MLSARLRVCRGGAAPRSRLCAVALSLLLLSVLPGRAQEPVHETVVVTATLEPIPFDSLARPVQVVTRQEIAALPVHSVAELLQVVGGVDVRTRGPMGTQADLSLRGSLFEQVLVLVDGVRVKNAQTGHHTADLPIALEDVERVEVLSGAGSSLYGSDAFGGTINIITRRPGTGRRVSAATGSDGLVEGSGSVGFERGAFSESFSGWGSRSSGFAYDRGFHTFGLSTSASAGRRTRLFLSHVSRGFGALGFYGPAPSYEWTNNTLASAERTLDVPGGWQGTAQLAYRTFGDQFLWTIEQPDAFRTRHRTHAASGLLKIGRSLRPGTRLTVGAEVAGDWIRSSSLGDHATARSGAFAELQHVAGRRWFLYPGLRFDRYGTFGGAWSPSFSTAFLAADRLKLRASAGRAFRVPTFTERFYRDPAHDASPDLRPESAWSAEAGADVTGLRSWTLAVTGFGRRERGVIDWTRPSADVRWRTTNIHRVWASGVEVAARHALSASGGEIRVAYSLTDVRLDGSAGLSKYVADFARHSVSASLTAPLPAGLLAGSRFAFKRRDDGRQYGIVDARLSRGVQGGRLIVFGELSNLLDVQYQEVRGVDMPGRSVRVGIQVPTF